MRDEKDNPFRDNPFRDEPLRNDSRTNNPPLQASTVGEEASSNPYSSSVQPGTKGVYEGGARRGLATGTSRAMAYIIDVVYLFVMWTAVGVLLELLVGSHMASFALISLVGMLLVEGVQWYLIATTGQSIGKRVLGVQIVRNFDNEPVGFVRGVMIRTWLSWIFFYASMMVLPLVWYVFVLVNFLMLMLAANRRTTLDHLAGTCVIEKGREMMDSIRQRSEQETLAGLGDIEREARGQTSEGGFENPFRE